MASDHIRLYKVLLNIACGFYFLFGLLWFSVSLYNTHAFNIWAFGIMAVFGAQLYYKHALTNLILGLILLFASIYGLLETLSVLGGKDAILLDKIIVAIPALSIIMSGILLFSYMKMKLQD